MSTITVELIIKTKTKFTSSNAEKINGFVSPQMSNFHIMASARSFNMFENMLQLQLGRQMA